MPDCIPIPFPLPAWSGACWLERARTSHSAEPLHANEYRIAPLDPETWERLRAHPQFK